MKLFFPPEYSEAYLQLELLLKRISLPIEGIHVSLSDCIETAQNEKAIYLAPLPSLEGCAKFAEWEWFALNEEVALFFPEDNACFKLIRKYYSNPVIFAGAGPGDPDLVTLASIKSLEECDVCLYDALGCKHLIKYLPKHAQAVYVGKRSKNHSTQQEEICRLIAYYVRCGKKVVRLKGGDPGIFGRLAEEIDTMDTLECPFRVIPGITSMSAATTGTGLMLTRRGLSRGFLAATPRIAGNTEFKIPNNEELLAMPRMFFMSILKCAELSEQLLASGLSPECEVTLILNASSANEKILSATLETLPDLQSQIKLGMPGLILVGKNASAQYIYKDHSLLEAKEFSSADELVKKEVLRLGGRVNAEEGELVKSVADFQCYCEGIIQEKLGAEESQD
ncbi:MAG: uroporphyrinogen-III C-methyltransferase [Planctomycetes bacterium]|nr:uroporphyrinogen-III C-methyltransferase [Planctomycetota bacterium]